MLFRSCTFTVALLADGELRRDRIISRDSLSTERADARLSAQKPDTFFIERADYVIYNNGDRELLSNALSDILSKNGGL